MAIGIADGGFLGSELQWVSGLGLRKLKVAHDGPIPQ
jgi:hypothetical protein